LSKLLILLLFSLFLAFFAEYRDHTLRRRNGSMDRLFTFLLILLLGTFCGLRTWYNDTVTYLQMFGDAVSAAEFFETGGTDLAHGWGFELLTCVIKDMGFSPQDYLMFYSFLTVTPYVLFVRKYCPHFTFGVFLMFTTGFYTFALAAIKQCMATGLCLLAVMAALDRQWIRYALLMGLAVLFHPYAIVYLLVPLLMFRPWTIRTYLAILLFTAAGFGLDSLIGTIIDITTMFGANYNSSSFIGEGVNMFRVLVAFVPLVLSIPYKTMLFRDTGRTEHLMFNLAMVHALLMFVGLFGTANYFGRLANYFLPAVVVVLPWMLNKLYALHRPFLKTACVVGYLGYFYFENAVKQNFDTHLSQISLWDYIVSHF